jgi:hypothetical protein
LRELAAADRRAGAVDWDALTTMLSVAVQLLLDTKKIENSRGPLRRS